MLVINIDENGEGDDPSSYEEEADTVLEREESDGCLDACPLQQHMMRTVGARDLSGLLPAS